MRHLLSFVNVFFPLVLICQPILRAQDWERYQVEVGALHPSLAVGTDGRVHMAYVMTSLAPRGIHHAVRENGVFEIVQVDSGGVDEFTSIAIDHTGSPHITYHSHENWAIRHSFWNGSAWTMEVIDHLQRDDSAGVGGHEGWSSSMTFDSNNRGRISHTDFPPGGFGTVGESKGLVYVSNDGTDWTTTIVGTTPLWVFDGTSLALDSQDKPYIAYRDSVMKDLMLAEEIGGVWSLTAVDTAGDVGQYPSLKIGPDDYPRIGYVYRHSELSAIVRLASFNGAAWTVTDIDTVDNLPEGIGNLSQHMVSLAISQTGETHLAYSDQRQIHHATVGISGAERSLVADYSGTDSLLEGSVWLGLDFDDVPHIAYSVTVASGSLPVGYYATRPSDGGSPLCEAITSFQARCNGSGTVQTRILLNNSTVHAGEEVGWLIDGVSYVGTIQTNGTHSRAFVSIPGLGPGPHTVELADPGDCFGPIGVTCNIDAVSDEEWETLEAQYGFGKKSAAGASARTRVLGNYPNPFNPSTIITYSVGTEGRVALRIYNTLGEEVATLVDEVQLPGVHSVVWDGKDGQRNTLSAGLYFYRVEADASAETKKLILMK